MVSQADRKILFLLSGLAAFFTLGVAGFSLANLTVYQPSTPDTLMPGAASQDLSLLAAAGLIGCILFIQRGSGLAWLIWVDFSATSSTHALYCFERLTTRYFCSISQSLD